MMTNRPWAKGSRWIKALGVCAGAVGLAALLGAAVGAVIAAPSSAASATALTQTAIPVIHRERPAVGLIVITLPVLL